MVKVAIVGRVNVGKSSLFNRLTETSRALVSEIPGTTRDRNYGRCFWRGFSFTLIDTGGLIGEDEKNPIQKQVEQQVAIALKEADLILLVGDGHEGKMPGDTYVAKLLRPSKKPLALVVNKIDSPALRKDADEKNWEKLGLGKPFLVSAASGSGTGDLLDHIVEILKANHSLTEAAALPEVKIAIIGKPNVGKSSLINALLGEERMIVSEIPFTTREPQDSLLEWQGHTMLLIDTAGIRKKARISANLEKVGVQKTLKVLRHADLALFLLDPFKEQIGHQDFSLARVITELRRSIILVVNKMDLLPKNIPSETVEEEIRAAFPHLDFASLLFISAQTKSGIEKILTLALSVAKSRKLTLSQEELDVFLKKALQAHEATIYTKFRQKTKLTITSIKQVSSNPPTIMFEKNTKDPLPQGFQKFIEKRFREYFGFMGTPIEFKVSTQEPVWKK